MKLNIVVTGGRDYRNRPYLFGMLDAHTHHFNPIRVAHGGATGADALANEWAESRGHEIVVYHAEWDKYGRRAGPIRNKKMLEAEQPDYVIAFQGGRGTSDCVSQARRLGLRVVDLRVP
jgi:hypothetical protein